MAAKEYEKTQELSTAMLLVCIFQFIYVADCLLYEVSEDLLCSTYSMLGFKDGKERGLKRRPNFYLVHRPPMELNFSLLPHHFG